ncbi:CASP-like protein 2B1 [Impatiens glandulifera]|uniref:CASP-like protein 2B1 n=1 Tax=Impatiens glandulifera TaxID=253017 RepID=UPI001FB0BA44|nr:CASP-like protein 2B1 [Impatiens glandulifera]
MMSSNNVGLSPGNVPVNHGGVHLKDLDRRVRTTELVLRFWVFFLGIVAVTLIVTDSQVREFFTIQRKATFTNMKSLVFLVAANAIAAGYSVMQGTRCIVSMVRGNVLFNKRLAWAIFSGDQVMAYLTVAAVSVSMQSSMFGKLGESKWQWMQLCDLYGQYCKQAGEGLASALCASIGMVALSGISAFSLFRLYE